MSTFFLLIAIGCALAAALIDQYLQGYRSPDAPAGAFWLVPMRLLPELYVPEKRYLARRAWWCLAGMLGAGLLALVTG